MDRAYSLLHVKALDAERRVISGIATTPEPDRRGDIIEPLGVSFTNPLPLLLFHDTERPVGSVTFKKPTKDGIAFDATIALIEEAGTLRDRVNEAWQSIKAGLISGVSIGFRALESAFMQNGGIHFLETEVVELSLVTVPANASASILTIKQLDLAATGRAKDSPMTTAEQITQWSTTRAPIVAEMQELMAKSAETGATLEETQARRYDGLAARAKSIEEQIERLQVLEKSQIAAATPITSTAGERAGTGTGTGTGNGHSGSVQVKANLAPGTGFIRYVQALAVSRGVPMAALEYAKRWKDSTPEVELILKAAVAAGTTTDATWAGPLVQLQNLTAEFLELLRPATVFGKIPGLTAGALQHLGPVTDRRRHVSVGRPGRAEAGGQAGVLGGHARHHEVRRHHRDHRGARAQLDALGGSDDPRRHDRGDRGLPRSRVHGPDESGGRQRVAGLRHQRRHGADLSRHDAGECANRRAGADRGHRRRPGSRPRMWCSSCRKRTRWRSASRSTRSGNRLFPGLGVAGGTALGRDRDRELGDGRACHRARSEQHPLR